MKKHESIKIKDHIYLFKVKDIYDADYKWVIWQPNFFMNKDGKWEWIPFIPNIYISEKPEFYKRTLFSLKEEALEVYNKNIDSEPFIEQWYKKGTKNG